MTFSVAQIYGLKMGVRLFGCSVVLRVVAVVAVVEGPVSLEMSCRRAYASCERAQGKSVNVAFQK